MPVHLRQYLIGPEPRLVRPDWVAVELAPGVHLSHCPTLPLATSAYGLVIGDAVATEDGDAGPSTWAGRWILVTGTRLRLDAGGLLGCIFRHTDRGLWVSSSVEILRELEPELPMHDDRLDRNWRLMDWYPPPRSSIDGIDRLLPSQILELRDGVIAARPLPAPDATLTREVVLSRVVQRLSLAVRGASAVAAAGGGRLWIGLTAGHDSRLVLAAAVAAGVEVTTYTFIRDKTSPADRELPPQLAAAAGLEHVRIPMDVVDADRVADFDRHTAAGYAGGARTQFTTGAWDRVEPSAVALEGGCFEFGRCYYYDRLPREMPHTAEALSDAIVERFPTQRPAAVMAWAAWALGEGRSSGLDWRDRFYLEQRMAGWLSAGLQGFDISARRQIHIANCEQLLSELISMEPSERRSGAHEAALVERMAPSLAALPYNPGSKGHGSPQQAERRPDPTRLRRWLPWRRPR